jgi:hypothetical protein
MRRHAERALVIVCAVLYLYPIATRRADRKAHTMNDTRTLPEIGEWYTTHKTGTVGWVCEIVPNKTGTFRLRLRTVDLDVKWTTFIPAEVSL